MLTQIACVTPFSIDSAYVFGLTEQLSHMVRQYELDEKTIARFLHLRFLSSIFCIIQIFLGYAKNIKAKKQ